MTTRKAGLGELETLVMLAVLRVDNEASVRRIRQEVATRGGRELSRGAMYATISRLEGKGFLRRSVVEPSANRGGRAEHRFAITKHGLATLRTALRHLNRMRTGLDTILDVP